MKNIKYDLGKIAQEGASGTIGGAHSIYDPREIFLPRLWEYNIEVNIHLKYEWKIRKLSNYFENIEVFRDNLGKFRKIWEIKSVSINVRLMNEKN